MGINIGGKVSEILKSVQKDEKEILALEKGVADNKEMTTLIKDMKKLMTQKKKVLQSMEKEVKKMK